MRPMRRTLAGLVLALLPLLAACSTVPSYSGGPTKDDPYAIVTPGDRVSVWAVDGKNAKNRLGDTYVSPGVHTIKVRVEYTVDYEGEGNYEWRDVPLDAVEGEHYVLIAKPDGGDGANHFDLPPYRVVAEPIRRVRSSGR
jgi:hypothetical protein